MYRHAFGEPHSAEIEPPALDFERHPIVAVANAIATELAELLGPIFWAALIVLLLDAELFWR
jgi:hypothetical protein